MTPEDFTMFYVEQLQTTFKGLNLTTITDPAEFQVKQYEDSVLPFELFPKAKELLLSAERVIDIGFGGGFPILPLSNHFLELALYGLEARKKKVDAVQEIAKKLQLSDIYLVHGRIEQYYFEEGDIILNKAVGSVGKILNLLNCERGARVLFYKGPNFFTNEGEELQTIKKSWSIILEESYKLSNGDERTVLVVEKNVPRGTISNKVKRFNALGA